MGSALRQSADTVAWFGAVHAEPYKYDLFSTIRFLDAWHADKPRIGEAIKVSDEVMVLRQDPTMAFAPAMLSRFQPANTHTTLDLDVAYDVQQEKHQVHNLAFGMFGPNNAMPLHITETAYSRSHNFGDHGLARFADVFHHRMISLFYRADANIEPTIEMDRPQDNRFDLFCGALAGLAVDHQTDTGFESPTEQLRIKWDRLFYTGLLSMSNRPADGLRSLLHEHLNTPIDIEQLTGGWLHLREADQMQLANANPKMQLGKNTSLGDAVFDLQHRFTIKIGPLAYDEFLELLPGKAMFEQVRELIRLYCGDEYDWDFVLLLKPNEIPSLQLGSSTQLGWTMWNGPAVSENGMVEVRLSSKGY